MRIIFTLVKKDLAIFLRNRTAFVLTFVVPIALIYIFGWVFGLNSKDVGPRGIALAVVNESDNPAAQKLVDVLKAEKSFRILTKFINPDKSERPLTEADLRPLMHDNHFRFAVVIPRDLIPANSIGLHLKILSNPLNEIETETVNGLLQKTIFSTAIGGAFGGDPEKIRQRLASGDFIFNQLDDTPAKPVDPSLRSLDTPTAPKPGEGAPAAPGPNAPVAAPATASSQKKAVDDFFSRIVKIDTEQVIGKDVKAPEATRVVGGWAIMFLLFALSNGAAAFFDEKNTGIFQRLLAAPVHRSQLLWSRFLYGILLGLVQLSVMFSAGSLMYGIDVAGHLGLLLVICTAAAAACTAFGMFVAAFTPNAQAAGGLSTFLVLTMSATGGAWFPISFMPPFIQAVGKCTLVYWSMEGFAQVLWAGNTFLEILPTVGILLAIAAGVMLISIWRLNRRNIFG
jgi:ABC-2 type transport system permease protein